MKVVKNSSKESKVANSNYNSSKNNAVKYGIFAKHAVMHWENKEDYDNLLKDLIEEYQPNNLTERHLIVDMANIIWSKMRLKYAEKASLQSELNSNVNYDSIFSGNKCANDILLLKEGRIEDSEVKSALTASQSTTNLEIESLKKIIKNCNKVIELADATDSYEEAFAVLNIELQENWEKSWKYYEGDISDSTAEGLASWLEEKKEKYEKSLYQLENRDKIKDQVLGSTFLSDEAMNKYMRYENHLDKKFEKTLAMFFKLREIRSNGGLTKSVL